MLRARLISLLLAATLWSSPEPVRAEIDQASELAALQYERRQLEREAAQYRASIDLLVANGARNDSPAIASLVRELGMLGRNLKEMKAREAELNAALTGKAIPGSEEEREAARLAEMLRRYYAEEQSETGAKTSTRS